MIRINLLPFRAARKKENIRRQISVFFLTLLLIAACLYMGSGYWKNKIQALNQDINRINSELSIMTAAAKEVDRIQRDLDALKQKTDVIRDLEKSRRAPVRMLEAMTELVVEKRMWFNSFSDTAGTIQIKGVALDNKTVADFMTRLEKADLFSSVNLDSLKQQTLKESLNLKSFEITCRKKALTNESKEKATS